MVGAGSSFSQSRRTGWEIAYVDYETLKLLLTHIELVYEQSNYEQSNYDFRHSEESLGSDVSLGNEDPGSAEPNPFESKEKSALDNNTQKAADTTHSKKTHRRRRSSLHPFNKKKKIKTINSDYRDQLFIESDSSDAFAMNSSDIESYETVANIPSNANFAFDTKGLIYDLDMVSMHDDVETKPIFNGNNNSSYQATGFHVDSNKTGGMNWATFTRSQKDSIYTTNVQLDSRKSATSSVYRSIKSRWRKKRRVPNHIQMAHAKARAITKRFLGLLSAEVEKVSLFVHARLGELADTMGSLRFANDEGDALGRSDNEYPLSDGGFHSSSSSSNGSVYSSDGDDAVARRMSFENGLSNAYIDPNPFSPSISTKQRTRRKKSAQKSRQDMEMRHERLRQSKPLFQRSDTVFGEDLSLLSAVDEADGYAAVGVEMIHLLRFIMVNTLAVRKLCVKHDRLLANRMLGGYHYKEVKRLLQHEGFDYSQINIERDQPRQFSIRKDSISEYNDYSSRVHGKAFADYRRELSLRLQSNQYKLVGIFDSKLQELMTSATSLSLSESMRQALYEYEVSMCRARALANLNGSQKKPRTKAQKLPLDESELCHYFPTPRFSFRSKYKENKPLSLTQDDSVDDEEEDDESTASTSTISLIRLRFVVASILGWQEASRATQSKLQSFLARTMLLYDSHGHLAGDRQSFYGCSRETLDFLMSYNSDLPLIIDDYKHMLRALQSSQLDDLMLACLVVSSGSPMEKLDTLDEFHAVSFQEKVCWNDRILGDIDKASYRYLFIAFSSLLVSTMNIYIIIPSAFSSAFSMGQGFIASLMLIGSSAVGAIFSLLAQSYIISYARNDNFIAIDISSYVVNLFFSISLIGLVGNGIFSYATSKNYYLLAIAGRLLAGTTFCEPITLFVVSSSTAITRRSAAAVYLKASSAFGMILGLFIGSIIYTAPFTVILDGFEIYINCETIYGLILCGLWTLILGSVINLCFIIPQRGTDSSNRNTNSVNGNKIQSNVDSPGSSDTPYNEEDPEGRSKDVAPFRKLHRLTEDSGNTIEHFDRRHIPESGSNVRNFMSNWNRAFKMTFRSASLPVCFLLLFFSSAITEMILNSLCLTMSHHFGWSYRLSGLCLTALSVLIILSNALVYYWTEYSEERVIMKNCLVPIIWGTVSLIYFPNMCTFMSKALSQNPTEWCTSTTILSILLVLLGSTFIFFGCTVIQNAALSVISKTSTSKLNRNPINCGILKSTALLFGKLFGNVLLVLIWVTYRLTGVDFMNFIAFTFIVMLALGYHRVKKNYFFLGS